MKWTEALVLDAIREAYLTPDPQTLLDEWAMLTQVPLRCLTDDGRMARAAGRKTTAAHINERIIDALLVRCWSSKQGHERIAFEVKVSRSDYKNETREKRAPAEASAHQCAYVAPAGLITPGELPEGWGLVEVYEDRTHRKNALGLRAAWTVNPKRRQPRIDLDYLVSAGFRRASRAEEAIRTGSLPEAEVARLRYENDRMHGLLTTSKAKALTEERRAKQARGELLALLHGDQSCADCGEKLTWKRGGPNDSQWAHARTEHDKPCEATRREADRLRREATNGAAYSWGFAGQPEPKVLREQRLADEEMETAS